MRTFVCYNILGGFSLLQSEILAKIFFAKNFTKFFRILLQWRNFVMPYEKKSNSELLLKQLDTLPHFCSGLLLNRAAEREISTRLSYARDLNTFFPYIIRTKPELKEKKPHELEASDLNCISIDDIDRFIQLFLEGHSPTTTARMRASISVMFNYLANTLRLIANNPMTGVTRVKVESKDYVIFLSLEEQETLINTIKYGTGLPPKQLKNTEKKSKRDLAIVFLFLDTGLRLSELQGLDVGDIDLDRCCATGVRRKGNEFREVYFSDTAAEYLGEYLEQRKSDVRYSALPSDPLFLNPSGNRISVRGIEKMLDKYIAAALPGRNDITVHKLRSSFAMSFYSSEKDILALQERMNHKSLNTTNIYAKAAENASKLTRNWRKIHNT